MTLGAERNPSLHPADSLKTKCWIAGVKHRARVTSCGALEVQLSPGTVQGKGSSTAQLSCKFYKHERGEHVASMKEVNSANIAYPSTKDIFVHPFWNVIKEHDNDLDTLYDSLAKLRPEISSQLFFYSGNNKYIHRAPIFYVDALNTLDHQSNLDALTACIGLLHEAKFHNQQYKYHRITQTILRLFMRIVLRYPLFPISDELFTYLKDRFLHTPNNKKWSDFVDNIKLIDWMNAYWFILDLIDSLPILRHHVTPPLSCLYLADPLLTPPILQDLWDYRQTGDWKKIEQHPEIKRFKRRIRIWETKEAKKQKASTTPPYQSVTYPYLVTSSRLVNAKQHHRSPKISPGGQSYRNTHLRGLAPNDQDAGKD